MHTCFRRSVPVVGPRHRGRHLTLRLYLHHLQVLPQILRVCIKNLLFSTAV